MRTRQAIQEAKTNLETSQLLGKMTAFGGAICFASGLSHYGHTVASVGVAVMVGAMVFSKLGAEAFKLRVIEQQKKIVDEFGTKSDTAAMESVERSQILRKKVVNKMYAAYAAAGALSVTPHILADAANTSLSPIASVGAIVVGAIAGFYAAQKIEKTLGQRIEHYRNTVEAGDEIVSKVLGEAQYSRFSVRCK